MELATEYLKAPATLESNDDADMPDSCVFAESVTIVSVDVVGSGVGARVGAERGRAEYIVGAGEVGLGVGFRVVGRTVGRGLGLGPK